MRWTIGADVVSTAVEGGAVLLDLTSKRYFSLNETGRVIWEGIRDGLSREAIVAALVERHEVSPETCRAAVDRLLADLASRQLVGRAP